MSRAKSACPFELLRVEVDGDDHRGTREARAGDRRVANASTSENCHHVTTLHIARVDRRAETRHDPTPDERGDCGSDGSIDRDHLSRRNHGPLCEAADAQHRRELGTVAADHPS